MLTAEDGAIEVGERCAVMEQALLNTSPRRQRRCTQRSQT
jgi:hypothetical protein